MSEWKEVLITDVTSKIGDGLHGTPKYDDTGLYYFINGNNLFQGSIAIKQETKKINKTEFEKYKKDLSEKSILLGINGTIGNVALYKGEKCILGKSACYINVNDRVLRNYLYYNFLNKDFQIYLEGIATGTTIPNVPLKGLREYSFLLPPLPEQERIAEVLSSLDDKIDLLHRQNKTLEEMAETLFRNWLNKLNGRESTTLGEYIKIQNGFAFKSNDFKDAGVNGVIKITNIAFEQVDVQNTQFVDEAVVSKLSGKFKVLPKSFLIAMTGAEIGKIGIVGKTTKKLYINQRVGMLVDILKNSSLLGYLFLKSAEGQDHIINTCTGSAQENISSIGIESMIVPQCTNDEIIDFCESVNPFFEKIISSIEQIQYLETLRDTLLPKLMSGEIKVKN